MELKELGTSTSVYCINGCIPPLLVHVSFPGPFKATRLALELLEACQAKCCFLPKCLVSIQDIPDISKEGPHCFNSLNIHVKNMANRYIQSESNWTRLQTLKREMWPCSWCSVTSISLIQAGPGKQHQFV